MSEINPVMHRKIVDTTIFILACILLITLNQTFVVCKPTDANHNRNLEANADDNVDSTTAESSNIRIDTLIKATEAVQEFQKLLNEQMMPVENLNSDPTPSPELVTTLEHHVHKHRHSKNHHKRKEIINDDLSTTPSTIADQGLDEENHRETHRRFNTLAPHFLAIPYECPKINRKSTQLLCPTRRRHGYHVCIDETALCNGQSDCPNGEDENPTNCMFYKMTMRYFKTVVDQVVELSEHVLQTSRHHNEEEL